MKKSKLFSFLLLILLFANCEKDFETYEVTNTKSNFNFKTITFKEVTKINKKTSQKILELKNDFFFPSFNYKIKDYDFDNLNDLHIQRYATNGLGMSYGYLITINKKLKFNHQQETDNLPNMVVDYQLEQIISDSIINSINGRSIIKNYHMWKNNKLINVN